MLQSITRTTGTGNMVYGCAYGTSSMTNMTMRITPLRKILCVSSLTRPSRLLASSSSTSSTNNGNGNGSRSDRRVWSRLKELAIKRVLAPHLFDVNYSSHNTANHTHTLTPASTTATSTSSSNNNNSALSVDGNGMGGVSSLPSIYLRRWRRILEGVLPLGGSSEGNKVMVYNTGNHWRRIVSSRLHDMI